MIRASHALPGRRAVVVKQTSGLLNPDGILAVFPTAANAPATSTDQQGTPYWNPITQRLGSFGGYGQLQVYNWRWEFDVKTESWIEVEKNDPDREPRCRATRELLPLDGGRKLLLFGGFGNTSGQQAQRDLLFTS